MDTVVTCLPDETLLPSLVRVRGDEAPSSPSPLPVPGSQEFASAEGRVRSDGAWTARPRELDFCFSFLVHI